MDGNEQETMQELGPGLRLRLPAGWLAQEAAGGTLVADPATGAKIRVFRKPSPKGAVTLERFATLGLEHLHNTLPGSQPMGQWQAVEGPGWQGTMQMLSCQGEGGVRRLLYTALILADADDPSRQDNVSVLLDVPEAVFAARAAFFRFLVPARLAAGTPPAPAVAAAAPMRLESQAVGAGATGGGGGAAEAPSVATPTIAPPAAGDEADADADLRLAAQGQKLVVYSIICNFLFRAAERSLAMPFPVLLLFGVLVAALTVNGVIKICSGLGRSQAQKIFCMVLSVIPLVNLAMLVFLSVKTTRALRRAGFEVGLLGAKP